MSDAPTRLGWSIQKRDWTIKAGSSAQVRLICVVTQFDGTPLPDYTGWTATFDLFLPDAESPAITKEPTVTGDDVALTLTVDIDFEPEDTEDLAPDSPVTLHGSVWFAHPSTTQQFAPLKVFLKVETHD